MTNSVKIQRLLFNPQILSAIIWAITIILCGQFSDESNIPTILITAAGFHVLMMNKFINYKVEN